MPRPRRIRNPERAVSVSRYHCLTRYLAMGPGNRSLDRLAEELRADGFQIGARTLAKWSADDGWVRQATEFDEERHAVMAKLLAKESADLQLRQVRLGKSLQRVAEAGVDRLLRNDQLLTNDVRALASAAKAGVTIERLAAGEATGRAEATVITYNRMITPILAAFQQAVSALAEPERERVSSFFALEVNKVRDEVLALGGPDDDEEEEDA